jgi:hypothetical protein
VARVSGAAILPASVGAKAAARAAALAARAREDALRAVHIVPAPAPPTAGPEPTAAETTAAETAAAATPDRGPSVAVKDPVARKDPIRAPSAPQDPASPQKARPTVEEAVDYFRLLARPDAVPEPDEVAAPAGQQPQQPQQP